MRLIEIANADMAEYTATVGDVNDPKKWEKVLTLGSGWRNVSEHKDYLIQASGPAEVVYIRAVTEDLSKAVGYLELIPLKAPVMKFVWDVMVHPEMVREGISTAMYEAALKIGIVIATGPHQTSNSRGMWLNFIKAKKHPIRIFDANSGKVYPLLRVNKHIWTPLLKSVYTNGDPNGMHLIMAKDMSTLESSVR